MHLWQQLQPHLSLGSSGHSSLQHLSSSIRLDGKRRCTAIFRSLQRCSIGLKSVLWLGHSRTFTELSWSHTFDILAVCLGSLSCWKMNRRPSLRSRVHWSRFSSRMALYIAAFIFPSILTSLPVPAAEKHPHSMMLPPPCFPLGMVLAWFPSKHDTWHSHQRVLIRPDHFVSLGLRVLQAHFGQLQAGCHVPFTKEWLPSGQSMIQAWWIAAVMVVLLEGSLLSTEECWSSERVTIGFLVTSLALRPRSPSLEGQPPLGRVLVVPNFFNLRMMEAIVLIGTFKAAIFFLYSSPDLFLKTILSRRSTDNSFDFMLDLCSDMHCQPGGPYIDRCVPFQIMSNQLNLPQGGLQLSCRNISSQGWSVETGCTLAQYLASWQRLCILMYMWFLSFLFLIN